jgi:DNA polymerase sigma
MYDSDKMTSKQLNVRDEVVNKIKKTLRQNKDFMQDYDDFTIEVFGSSANSLWTRDSDIDLEISMPDYMDHNPCDILSDIDAALRPLGADTERIFGSRIPLITLKLESPPAIVDISVNNPLAIHNS